MSVFNGAGHCFCLALTPFQLNDELARLLAKPRARSSHGRMYIVIIVDDLQGTETYPVIVPMDYSRAEGTVKEMFRLQSWSSTM